MPSLWKSALPQQAKLSGYGSSREEHSGDWAVKTAIRSGTFPWHWKVTSGYTTTSHPREGQGAGLRLPPNASTGAQTWGSSHPNTG
jgi:hypothetical protein